MVDSYSDGWTYHRNIISEKNKLDGHKVTILTTQYAMKPDGTSCLDMPGISYNSKGIKINRLHDMLLFTSVSFSKKLNWTKGLYGALKDENPDIIMIHNLQFLNLNQVIRYKRKHPEVILLGDTHAEENVSIGKNSKKSKLAHKYFWGPIIRRNFKYFDRFFYICVEAKVFFERMYRINLDNALLAPLPAPIMDKIEKNKVKKFIRDTQGVKNDTLLFVHSGKLEKKKRTKELLHALARSRIDCEVLIIGEIPDTNKSLYELINADSRVQYLGWKSGDELRKYIAAADLYLQPGSMSITMQNAICVGTPVMIYPHNSYEMYCNGCEYMVESEEDIYNVFECIQENVQDLQSKINKCFQVANKYFSPDMNAKQIYELALERNI